LPFAQHQQGHCQHRKLQGGHFKEKPTKAEITILALRHKPMAYTSAKSDLAP